MQIVSNGDNLHEMSNPVFLEKQEKRHQSVVCWFSPGIVKAIKVIDWYDLPLFSDIITEIFAA